MTKKFRIWDTETKTFLQELAPYYWHVPRSLGNFDEEIFGEANLHDFSTILNNRGFEIQQWTGLTDSQGVEIYEGDIVAYFPQLNSTEAKCEVVSCVGGFRLARLHSKKGVLLGAFVEVDGEVDSLKVISNIFQTPELLEKCSK